MDNAKRPLNILQVSTSAFDLNFGAESSAWNLFKTYRNLGHNSWLAVGFKGSNAPDVFTLPNDECRDKWAQLWIAISNLLLPLVGKFKGPRRIRRWIQWIGQLKSLMEIQKGYENFDFPGTWKLLDMTKQPPDIVHCHNLHGGYFDLRTLPWLSNQVPVILNLRDAWLLSGHCAHSFDCEKWKFGCGNCPDLSIYPAIKRDATAYNWQQKYNIYKKCKLYITTPSQWLMDKVNDSMLQGAVLQYRVIPNGVDQSIFFPGNKNEARKSLGLPENAKIVLLIAHSIFRDYETMEYALKRVSKIGDFDFLFICLGRKGFKKNLGNGQIIYKGIIKEPKQMAQYYRASDVYIHAAKGESWGKTITEAMACGLPVVATAIGGIAEQIENAKTGFLVPPKDFESMSKLIYRLLTDKTLNSSIGQAAVSSVNCCFGLEIQVKAFLDWYYEILEDWKQK